VYGRTSGNAIPNNSVFQRDLNESNVTANLVLSDRLSKTVGALKLKAFLYIPNSARQRQCWMCIKDWRKMNEVNV